MAKAKKVVPVVPNAEKGFVTNEPWRIIHYDNDYRQTVHNVEHVDTSGNWTRLMCDEGYVLVHADRVLYMRMPKTARVK